MLLPYTQEKEATSQVAKALGDLRNIVIQINYLLTQAEIRLANATGPVPVAEGEGTVSQREIEVLRLVAGGLSNVRIAGELVLSVHTVHRHVSNIMTKLGVSSRAAAIAKAASRGLI
jgi:DNA-binding NarL/FixJ family response regulator